jgi:hypothetical protein
MKGGLRSLPDYYFDHLSLDYSAPSSSVRAVDQRIDNECEKAYESVMALLTAYEDH